MDFITKAFIIILMLPTLALADEVVLKSGQKIEGRITEQTDKYVKIDSGGVALTYYSDEISTVVGPAPQEPVAGQSEGDQSLLDFKLGVNNVGEHKVIFGFPEGQMFDALCMNCETIHLWKNTTNQKAKLIVHLYDHNRKLLYAQDSGCDDGLEGAFRPVNFIDVDKEIVKNIGYFSISTQVCSGPVKLSDDKSRDAFAEKVISAIKQGKDPFLALYSNQPTSEEKIQEQEQARSFLLDSLNKGAQFTGFTPANEQDAIKYKDICSEPLNLNIGSTDNTTHKDGVTESGSFQLGITVGKVNGEWKILFAE